MKFSDTVLILQDQELVRGLGEAMTESKTIALENLRSLLEGKTPDALEKRAGMKKVP